MKCVEGRGLEGDRFFDYKAGYSGQITFFAMEIYEELCRTLQIFDKPRVCWVATFISAASISTD